MTRECDADVATARDTGAGLDEQPDARVDLRGPPRDGEGALGGAAVDHDQLVVRAELRQHAGEQVGQAVRVVEHRGHDADRGLGGVVAGSGPPREEREVVDQLSGGLAGVREVQCALPGRRAEPVPRVLVGERRERLRDLTRAAGGDRQAAGAGDDVHRGRGDHRHASGEGLERGHPEPLTGPLHLGRRPGEHCDRVEGTDEAVEGRDLAEEPDPFGNAEIGSQLQQSVLLVRVGRVLDPRDRQHPCGSGRIRQRAYGVLDALVAGDPSSHAEQELSRGEGDAELFTGDVARHRRRHPGWVHDHRAASSASLEEPAAGRDLTVGQSVQEPRESARERRVVAHPDDLDAEQEGGRNRDQPGLHAVRHHHLGAEPAQRAGRARGHRRQPEGAALVLERDHRPAARVPLVGRRAVPQPENAHVEPVGGVGEVELPTLRTTEDAALLDDRHPEPVRAILGHVRPRPRCDADDGSGGHPGEHCPGPAAGFRAGARRRDARTAGARCRTAR